MPINYCVWQVKKINTIYCWYEYCLWQYEETKRKKIYGTYYCWVSLTVKVKWCISYCFSPTFDVCITIANRIQIISRTEPSSYGCMQQLRRGYRWTLIFYVIDHFIQLAMVFVDNDDMFLGCSTYSWTAATVMGKSQNLSTSEDHRRGIHLHGYGTGRNRRVVDFRRRRRVEV
jgi:hypothetical protein